MAMLTTEEVIRELEGEDESGRRTLLTMDDINKVRSRFKDYAFIYSKREGGHTACSGCGGLLERTVERRGDSIFCPRCRKTVRAYEEWRGHKHLYEQVMVYIWKRSRQDPETILAKAIYAEKYFGFQNPEDTPLGARVAALYQFGPKGAKSTPPAFTTTAFIPIPAALRRRKTSTAINATDCTTDSGMRQRARNWEAAQMRCTCGSRRASGGCTRCWR